MAKLQNLFEAARVWAGAIQALIELGRDLVRVNLPDAGEEEKRLRVRAVKAFKKFLSRSTAESKNREHSTGRSEPPSPED